MRGLHYSLRWLFGVVSFLAVGCGLLIYASPFFSKLAFTGTVVVLLAAGAAAIYRAGDQRSFWAGFAAFGFAYLWMVCGTWQSPDGSTAWRERLVTSDLLWRCYEKLPSSQAGLTAGPFLGMTLPAQSGTIVVDPAATYTDLTVVPYSYATLSVNSVAKSGVDRTDFLATGHSLFAIVFALLGGVVTRRCWSRARAGLPPTP